MLLAGQKGIKISNFGGLNTLLDATNCPIFMSPDCLDVEFYPQTVKSRPPTRNLLSAGPLAVSVNYLKTFILPNGTVRTLFYDNLGNLFYEDVTNAPGVSTLITSDTLPNCYPNSVTQFGREYIAFGDGQQGLDIPRQYDGTTLSRISQDGPGQGPGVVDESVSWLLANPAGAGAQALTDTVNSASESGFTVTINTAGFGPQNLRIGDPINIVGVGAGYNGPWTVSYIPSPTSFQYIATTSGLAPVGVGGTAQYPLATFAKTGPPLPSQYSVGQLIFVNGVTAGVYNNLPGTSYSVRAVGAANLVAFVGPTIFGAPTSGNGTVTNVGSIVQGTHQVSVMFETATGYITRPAPITSWTAAGGFRGTVTGIPIGPPNTIARILIFTPISSSDFYWIPQEQLVPDSPVLTTVIPNNTDTTATVNFNDADLLDGEAANDFFNLITLPPCVGFVEYASRIVAIGALNTIQRFLNLSFDGGFQQGASNWPLGWTPDAVSFTGGGESTNAVFGNSYSITATGPGPTYGLITQPASKDYLSNPILTAGKAYTVAAYFKKNNITLTAHAFVKLSSVSAGYSQVLDVNCGTQVFVPTFTRITANFTALPTPLPDDLTLSVYATGLVGGDTIFIDELQFYPTDAPRLNAALVSDVEDAESYNGLTGLLQPTEENGQQLNSAFVIRDFLYLVKDRSLFVTQDNDSEPSGDTPWSIDEVSQKVGTPSFRGVGVGDEWALIAAESGLWMFTGGILSDENKLSNEIQPTWDSINWLKGFLIDVKVDTKRKRAYVNVPFGTSTLDNTLLTVDYVEGWGDATNSNGNGRKWSPWAISANSQNLLLRQDDTIQMCFGGNLGNNHIFQLDAAQLTNNPIDAHWESGYFQDGERLNFGYITANVAGVGVMEMILRRGDQSWYRPIRSWFLNRLSYTNAERVIQQQGYRMAVRFGITNIPNTDALSFFSLQNFSMYVREADYAPVRGINA